MNIKEREKDYIVYLLWLFGVIPSNILRNYIIVNSPTLRAQKVLYLIEQINFAKPDLNHFSLKLDLN